VKNLITLTVLAAFVAMSAPAFAPSYDPSAGSGNIVPGPRGGMPAGTSGRPLYNFAPHYRAHMK
jgi:hypothetical protein